MRSIQSHDCGTNSNYKCGSGFGQARKKVIASAAIAAASVLLGSREASAATGTWHATSGGSWSASANWTSAVPGDNGTTPYNSPDIALFNINSGIVTVDASRNVGSITFDGSAGAFTLGSGNLLLTSGGEIQLGTTATSFTHTNTTESINSPITLEGSYSFLNNSTTSSDVLNFGGNIGNGAAVTLTLGGVNTGANTISGIISNGVGATGLTVSAGAWTLSGVNTFTGATTISAGALQLANSLALQNSVVTISAANGLTFQSGLGSATLAALSGASNETLTDAGSAAAGVNVGNYFNAAASTYSGNLSGLGGITKFGTNAETFSGINTYSGATNIGGVGGLGTLSATGAAADTTPLGTGTINLNGGTLALTPSTAAGVANWTGASGITSGNAVNYSSGNLLVLTKNTTGSLTYTLGGSGTDAITRVGKGTLLIKTANTDLGTGENLIFNGIAPVTSGNSANMVNPSIVGLGVTTSGMGDFLTYNSGFQSDYSAYTPITANITSATNDSADILDIQQGVTISANTSAGALVIEGNRPTNTTAAADITIAANTTLTLNGSNGQAGVIFNGYNTAASKNSGFINASSTTTSVLNFGTNEGILWGFGNSNFGGGGAGSNYISAVVAGTGGITLAGSAIVSFENANNTFSGGITVNAGSVLEQLTNPGQAYSLFTNGVFGDPNNSVTLNGGIIAEDGPGATASANLFGAGRSLILGSNGGVISAGLNDWPIIAATISGSGPLLFGNTTGTNLTLAGDGSSGWDPTMSEITGANTNTGGVFLNGSGDAGGIAIISADDNLGAPTDPVDFNGGVLAIFGTSLNSFGLHPVTFSPGASAGLDILNASNTFTINQPIINDPGTFYKFGLGTLDLTAAENFGATVQVLGGTLKVDESQGGAINPGAATAAPLNFGGGSVYVLGNTSGTTTQNFGALTMFSGGRTHSGTGPYAVYGGGSLIADNNGGTLFVNLGAIGGTAGDTSNSAVIGNALDIVATDSGTPGGTSTITTTTNKDATGIYGGRIVYTDATGATNWATTASGASPYTLSGYSAYSTLAAASSTSNVRIQANGGGATNLSSSTPTINSLKIESPAAGDSLALGSNNLTLAGGGLLMTGSNNFVISSTGGTLTSSLASSTSQMGLNVTNTVPVNAGSDLIVQQYGTGTLTISAPITNYTTSAMSSLTKAGPGKLVLSAANSYTGFTYVDGGILSITNDANLGGANGVISVTNSSASSPTVTVASLPSGFGVGAFVLGGYVTNISGTTLTLSGNASTAITSGAADWASAEDLALNGGALQVTGGASVSLSEAALTTSGISGGTITFNRPVLVGPSGGKIDVTSGGTLTLAGTFTNYGSTIGAPTNLTIDSSDGSAGTVIVPGASWTGGYTLQGGTLRFTSSSSIGAFSGVFSTINFAANEHNSSNTGHLVLNGLSPILAGLNSSLASAVIEDGNGSSTSDLLGIDNGDNETYAGTLVNTTTTGSGILGLFKAGGGMLSLTNAGSNYTGVTEIDGGIVNVAALAAGGANSSIGAAPVAAANIVFGGGTLQYTGSANLSTNRLFTLGDAGNVVESTGGVGGNNGTIDSSGSGTVAFTGTGAIAFAQTGVHNLTLTGSNTGANTFNPILGDSTYNSTVFPTSLTKSGAGTWVLTNANTFTGATTINGGVLSLTGSLVSGSAVTVGGASASGTPTLTGTGTANGNVTASSAGGGAAGIINPGGIGTVGTLTVGGGATFSSGSKLAVDIEAGASNADKLAIGGAATVAAGALISFNQLGTPNQGNYVLVTAASGLSNGAFTVSGSLPTDYKLIGTGTALDLTEEGIISLGTVTAPSRLFTGTTGSASVAVTNTAATGAAALNFTATGSGQLSGTSTGTVPVGTPGSASLTFSAGSTLGNETGTFSVADSNAQNTPQTATATVDVVGARTLTAGSVNFSRFILGTTATGQTSAVASTTGNHTTVANVTLNSAASATDGVITASSSSSQTFDGTNGAGSIALTETGSFTSAGTQTGSVTVAGNTTNFTGELTGQTLNPLTVAYSADPVNQRIITNGGVTNLGNVHVGGTSSIASNPFTTSGTHDTTEDVTVSAGGGSGAPDGNGVTLSGGSTLFNGASNSATRTFGGTLAGSGTETGSFSLAVTGEGLPGEPSYSPVTIAYTANVYSGQSVWATNGAGSWGTATTSFGTNWGATQGSPGLDPNFVSSDTATFDNTGLSGGGSAIVTLDGANPSLAAMTFNTSDGSSYTIAQGTGGMVTFNGGSSAATLTNNGGSHAISAPVALNTDLATSVANSTDTLTVSGQISGAHALTTSGSGALVLSGVNTYTGGTTINSGKLIANAARSFGPGLMSSTGSGVVTVAIGGTLAGNGGTGDVVVNGTITAGSGATSSDTIGSLTTGNQSWNSGGTYVAKVSADGTMNDLLIMSGLTVAASSGSPFNINLISQGTTTLTAGQQLVIGQIIGASAGSFSASDLSLMLTNVTLPAGDTAELVDMASGGNDDLVVEAAPEPTSALLFGIVTAPIFLARRRRSESPSL